MPFPRHMGALVQFVETSPPPEALFITDEELPLTDGECHSIGGVGLQFIA